MAIEPNTTKQLTDALASAATRGQTISLGGHFSKRLMGGPIATADVTITTRGMNRILKYEPTDLTLSVEAGASFAEVSRVLAENQQMIPLDPPFRDNATVGGVIATNGCGPRRRLYGSARDYVIGMQFATLQGKLVQSGGMVVKNVAGLDMGKLMIGSFGTLAAIAVVNFKLSPKPALERTCLLSLPNLDAALAARDKIVRSVLQPAAVDLLNPAATAGIGLRDRGYLLAVQFGGNAAVVTRYERELSALATGVAIEGEDQARFWEEVENYSPGFMERNPGGAVVRVSSTMTQMRDVLASLLGAGPEVPTVARAASGVSYACFPRTEAAVKWLGILERVPGGAWWSSHRKRKRRNSTFGRFPETILR